MNIIINDRECEAKTGDRLLDVARAGHSHIGYFCGGNAICQTCYVKVLEGMDNLSALTEPEKSMLSEKLIAEGSRMACQAKIVKPGTIKVLSAVEEVKRMASNPLEYPAYMGKMGWESLVKIPDTLAFQARREQGEYRLELMTLLKDVAVAIADAAELVLRAFGTLFGSTPAETMVETTVSAQETATPAEAPKKEVCPSHTTGHTVSLSVPAIRKPSSVSMN